MVPVVCPDGNEKPSAPSTATASGGRLRPTSHFTVRLIIPMPAAPSPATSSGSHDLRAHASAAPTTAAVIAAPTGLPTSVITRIVVVNQGCRCAARKLTAGRSATAMPSLSSTLSSSCPKLSPNASTAPTPSVNANPVASPGASRRPSNHPCRG